MSILVIDVGTSGVRAAIVHEDATIAHEQYREALPSSPAARARGVRRRGVGRRRRWGWHAKCWPQAAPSLPSVSRISGPRRSCGIAQTGTPVGPGLGWQDLRTVGECLGCQAEGLRLAPNLSATKVCHLLDLHDADRDRDLCFGTVDSWIVWKLTKGAAHVTDLSNAAVTGLINRPGSDWDSKVLSLLRIPARYLPTIVDSSGHDRRSHCARRRASDHRDRRRSTGVVDRPRLRRTRPGQDHLRHRRHARRRRRSGASDVRHTR